MTLDNLRAFCAVVESGGFRAAAGQVHLSQPAVSQHVKALERAFGQTLVDRGTGKPTPAGTHLYTRARALLNDAQSLSRAALEFDESAHRILRIGTSDTTALYFLPPIVRRFSRKMPGVRIEIVNRPTRALVERVERGELDLGIVTLPNDSDALEQRVLVVHASHWAAGRKRLSLDAVRDEPFLLLDDSTRTGSLLRSHFREIAFEPQVALHSGSFEVIKRYVSEGIGVAVLPEMAVARADRVIVPVRVPGLPGVTIGAIWRKNVYRTEAERVFSTLAFDA